MAKSESAERQSKNARRAEARDKAREMRDAQRRRERRNTLLLQGGIALAAVAIIAVVTLVIMNSVRPDAPGPRNMASDGLQVGANFEAVTTPALQPDEEPVPSPESEQGVVALNIWVDYLCPACGQFEQTNSEVMRMLIESGAATIEFHPIAILGNQGASARAANAAACVADRSPDNFFDFNELLLTNQPTDGSVGWTDDQLVDYAAQAGVTTPEVRECVAEEEFASWVLAATNRALSGPLPVIGTEVEAITGTPTVLVDGDPFLAADPTDPTEFAQFVLRAAGEDFTMNPTPSPSPSAEGDEEPEETDE